MTARSLHRRKYRGGTTPVRCLEQDFPCDFSFQGTRVREEKLAENRTFSSKSSAGQAPGLKAMRLAEMTSFPRSLCPRKHVLAKAGAGSGNPFWSANPENRVPEDAGTRPRHAGPARSGLPIRAGDSAPDRPTAGLNGPGKGANIRGVRVRPDFIPTGKPDTA